MKSNEHMPTKQYTTIYRMSHSKTFHPYILIFCYCELIYIRKPPDTYPLKAEQYISFIQQILLHNGSLA